MLAKSRDLASKMEAFLKGTELKIEVRVQASKMETMSEEKQTELEAFYSEDEERESEGVCVRVIKLRSF